MEIEKPCPFEAFTKSHLKGPVIASAMSSCSAPCAPSHISVLLSSFHLLRYFQLRGDFSSLSSHRLGVVIPSAFRRCLLFVLPASRPVVSMWLKTFASRSRALAIASKSSAREPPSSSYQVRDRLDVASEFARLPQTHLGQRGVLFVSSRRVPFSRFSSHHYGTLSLKARVLWFHSVFLLSRAARLGLINLEANLFQGPTCVFPHNLSAFSSPAVTAKS